MQPRRLRILTGGLLLAALAACAGPQRPAAEPAALAPVRAEVLLEARETVLGEAIIYPTDAPAKVTMAIITIEPGAEIGWHTHAVPLAAYLLDGELEVTYRGHGPRVYRAGDALVEAMAVPHAGHNRGAETVRILAVFAGAGGLALSDPAPE